MNCIGYLHSVALVFNAASIQRHCSRFYMQFVCVLGMAFVLPIWRVFHF